jgi:hypothetical protein
MRVRNVCIYIGNAAVERKTLTRAYRQRHVRACNNADYARVITFCARASNYICSTRLFQCREGCRSKELFRARALNFRHISRTACNKLLSEISHTLSLAVGLSALQMHAQLLIKNDFEQGATLQHWACVCVCVCFIRCA